MSWHFHDAVVEIELARIKPNGKLADPKLMTYKQVRTMLDDAAQAKALLDARLREVQQHEAISVGAKVDLWIDELDTNVRAVITDIGRRQMSVRYCAESVEMPIFYDPRCLCGQAMRFQIFPLLNSSHQPSTSWTVGYSAHSQC